MYAQYQINREMLQIARRQFCLDVGLEWQQYLAEPGKKCYIQKARYKVGTSYPQAEGARCYHGTDAFFKAVMCMGQLFLTVDEQIYDWAMEKFSKYPPEWFCEYGNLRMIDEKLREYGRAIKDTHVYFLPREEEAVGPMGVEVAGVLPTVTKSIDNRKEGTSARTRFGGGETATVSRSVEKDGTEGFTYEWYEQEEILRFKENNRFTSAICFSPTQPDMLAVAALKGNVEAALMDSSGKWHGGHGDRGKSLESGKVTVKGMEIAEELYYCKEFDQSQMAGMAGVSADGKYLWQIGINVIPEYAGRGLGVKLVRQLKEEIIRRGKVPFYGTSESHTVSQSIAIKAGFLPAWTEIYVKSIEN